MEIEVLFSEGGGVQPGLMKTTVSVIVYLKLSDITK